MEKRWILAACLALAVFTGCWGNDDSPSGPILPLPTLCPFTLDTAPVAGFPGLYTLEANPGGPYTLRVNGTSRSVEAGVFVTALSGDLVQGCRDCGCSEAVQLR